MTIIAHLSDLHFGRERSRLVEALLTSLATVRPDAIIISGDLTQRAKPEEYRAAADFLRRLERPHLTVPGNHDLSATNLLERFHHPWRQWRTMISNQLEPQLTGTGFVAAGLNTARKWSTSLDWSRGRINQEQIAKVLDKLGGRDKNALGIVVAHHPFWLPDEYLHRGLVGRRDQALQAFQGEVDIILSGHVHLPYIKAMQGVIISHAGTTISSRLVPGFANNYNLVHGDQQRLTVDRMGWDEETFHRELSCTFRREAAGWVLVDSTAGPCGGKA